MFLKACGANHYTIISVSLVAAVDVFPGDHNFIKPHLQ